MTESLLTLEESQILIERNVSSSSIRMGGSDDNSGDHGDVDTGTVDSYSVNSPKLKSTYTIVNGEGSDGDTDGSESDGDDARF